MTYPMPPELLEQLGLEPCADTPAEWPADHDLLGWGRRPATGAELEERGPVDSSRDGEHGDGR